jgi:curved DNA-binding protein CbpA
MNAITRSTAAQRLHGADWNPYEILGLIPPASDKQIRAAYRQLAKVRHSDVTGDDEAFLVVKEAHDFLLDPIARGLWDSKKLRATQEMRDAAIRNLRALCTQAVDAVINGLKPPEYADIPALMRADLNRRLGELEHTKRRTEGVIRRTRLLEGNVKRKGKGDNIVAAVLAGRIAEAERILEGITREQEIGEIMRAELEAYSSTAAEEADAAWDIAPRDISTSTHSRSPTSFFTFTMS